MLMSILTSILGIFAGSPSSEDLVADAAADLENCSRGRDIAIADLEAAITLSKNAEIAYGKSPNVTRAAAINDCDKAVRLAAIRADAAQTTLDGATDTHARAVAARDESARNLRIEALTQASSLDTYRAKTALHIGRIVEAEAILRDASKAIDTAFFEANVASQELSELGVTTTQLDSIHLVDELIRARYNNDPAVLASFCSPNTLQRRRHALSDDSLHDILTAGCNDMLVQCAPEVRGHDPVVFEAMAAARSYAEFDIVLGERLRAAEAARRAELEANPLPIEGFVGN